MGKKSIVTLCICAIFAFFETNPSFGATFCVDSSKKLISALQKTSLNGQDDVIKIVCGTYLGNFIYSSTEQKALTILGGYESGCSTRTAKPSKTVLDGNHAGIVLVLSNNTAASFSVSGLTITNGLATSGRGAGLYVNGGIININSNIISRNTGPYHTYGGGIYALLQGPNGKIIITNNTISHNSIKGAGGGIYAARASGAEGGTILLRNNRIFSNETIDYGTMGGGVAIDAIKTVTLSGNTVISNKSEGFGGGVSIGAYLRCRTMTLVNNVIAKNIGQDGGGLFNYIGLDSFDNTLILTNNTIFNNTAKGKGGGLYLASYAEDSVTHIYNNIVWRNQSINAGKDFCLENDKDANFIPSKIIIKNNNFNKNSEGIYATIPFLIHSSNLNNRNPLFANSVNDNYRLSSTDSPCFNRGNNNAPDLPTTDREGNPRIMDSKVDMGAYEYVPEQ